MAAAAMNGSGPPRCMAWTTPTCTCVVHATCGRGGRAWEHGYHLSLFDVCSVADWLLITDRRPDNSMDLMLLRQSCNYADSEVITVNSDYTCCAEHLMLNLRVWAQKTDSEWVTESKAVM